MTESSNVEDLEQEIEELQRINSDLASELGMAKDDIDSLKDDLYLSASGLADKARQQRDEYRRQRNILASTLSNITDMAQNIIHEGLDAASESAAQLPSTTATKARSVSEPNPVISTASAASPSARPTVPTPAPSLEDALGTDFVSMFRIVLNHIWLVILAGILGMFAALILTRQITPIYESESSVVITVLSQVGSEALLEGIDVLRPDIQGTYVQILGSTEATMNAYTSLSGMYDLEKLQDADIDIQPVNNSLVVLIRVQSEDPLLARDLANEIAIQAIGLNPIDAFVKTFPLKILDEAQIPQKPIIPDVRQNLLFGIVAGLAVGVGMAFLLDIVYKVRQKNNLESESL